jgi:hypothetical protein
VQVAPADFLATAGTELDGSSLTASYGPPYNVNGTPQSEWFAPASWAGVPQPIDAAQTFVLGPLATAAPTDPALAAALATELALARSGAIDTDLLAQRTDGTGGPDRAAGPGRPVQP